CRSRSRPGWDRTGRRRTEAVRTGSATKKAARGRPFSCCGQGSGSLLGGQLFLDAGRLAGAATQVVELGATDIAATLHLDAGDQRGIGLEGALDAFAGADLAHDEAGVEAAVALGDH